MRFLSFNKFIWVLIVYVFVACHKKDEDCLCDCICNSNEICLYDECYLKESVHSIGGTMVIAPNSYVGVATGNLCIDTLIFYNDTSRALDDERFGLFAETYHEQVWNVIGSYPFQADTNEFYSSSSVPLCYLNGEAWYANLHFIIYPDSVWMNLGFWTLNGPSGELIDSCSLMFYKKK